MADLKSQEKIIAEIGDYVFAFLDAASLSGPLQGQKPKLKISVEERKGSYTWKISTFSKKLWHLTIDRNYLIINLEWEHGKDTPSTVSIERFFDYNDYKHREAEDKLFNRVITEMRKRFSNLLKGARFVVA
jgi:hypothetical protein